MSTAASDDAGPPAGAARRPGLYFQLYVQGSKGPVRWRLLNGNRRDMGRGAAGFADEESCRVAIKEMLAHLDQMQASLLPSAGHRWDFRLSYQGQVIVVSGHGFDRRNRCEQAARRFLKLASAAEIRGGVTVLSTPGQSPPIGRRPFLGRPTVRTRWSGVHQGGPLPSPGSDVLWPQREQRAQPRQRPTDRTGGDQ